MKTGKQLPSIYSWPHLEILETVTCETEESPWNPMNFWSNLRIISLVIDMIRGGRGEGKEGKKETFLSESIQNILFLLQKKSTI